MKRFAGLIVTVALATVTLLLGAVPAVAACHIVGFTESNYLVKEDAGRVTITIERQVFGAGCPATINYTTGDDSAKDPSDYRKTSGTLIYGSTEASKSFTVSIVDDKDSEQSEAFKVSFTGNSPGPVSGSATVTIEDEDVTAAESPPPASTTESPTPEVTTQSTEQPVAEEEDEGGPSAGLIVGIIAVVLAAAGGGALAFFRRKAA